MINETDKMILVYGTLPDNVPGWIIRYPEKTKWRPMMRVINNEIRTKLGIKKNKPCPFWNIDRADENIENGKYVRCLKLWDSEKIGVIRFFYDGEKLIFHKPAFPLTENES